MERHELMIRITIFLIEQAQQRSVFDYKTTIYDLDRDDDDDDSMDEERGTGDILWSCSQILTFVALAQSKKS